MGGLLDVCWQGDYRIIGSAEIQAEMVKLTGEVASVLDIPTECARTLLIHFRCGTVQRVRHPIQFKPLVKQLV